jgi:hypothetical protein
MWGWGGEKMMLVTGWGNRGLHGGCDGLGEGIARVLVGREGDTSPGCCAPMPAQPTSPNPNPIHSPIHHGSPHCTHLRDAVHLEELLGQGGSHGLPCAGEALAAARLQHRLAGDEHEAGGVGGGLRLDEHAAPLLLLLGCGRTGKGAAGRERAGRQQSQAGSSGMQLYIRPPVCSGRSRRTPRQCAQLPETSGSTHQGGMLQACAAPGRAGWPPAPPPRAPPPPRQPGSPAARAHATEVAPTLRGASHGCWAPQQGSAARFAHHRQRPGATRGAPQRRCRPQ